MIVKTLVLAIFLSIFLPFFFFFPIVSVTYEAAAQDPHCGLYYYTVTDQESLSYYLFGIGYDRVFGSPFCK